MKCNSNSNSMYLQSVIIFLYVVVFIGSGGSPAFLGWIQTALALVMVTTGVAKSTRAEILKITTIDCI